LTQAYPNLYLESHTGKDFNEGKTISCCCPFKIAWLALSFLVFYNYLCTRFSDGLIHNDFLSANGLQGPFEGPVPKNGDFFGPLNVQKILDF